MHIGNGHEELPFGDMYHKISVGSSFCQLVEDLRVAAPGLPGLVGSRVDPWLDVTQPQTELVELGLQTLPQLVSHCLVDDEPRLAE